jgi:3',5'-cyclic AMP phosphodiesterase CpdA
MRVLVISDLHIGKHARTKRLCPYTPDKERKEEYLVSSFFDDLAEDIRLNGPIDYIIIPGDLTDKAGTEECKCASEFIEEMSAHLNVELPKFILTLGNHDIDWSGMKKTGLTPAEIEIEKEKKYDTLFDDRFHSLGSVISKELITDPFFKIKEFDDALFVIFNSAWHDAAESDSHYGIIEQKHLDNLRAILSGYDLSNKLKFFILHHHPYQYPNIYPTWTDFSCLQNGGALLNLLSEYCFDFVVHGHKHVPYFYTIELNHLCRINLLCSGSYSSEIPIEIAGHVANLYHLIQYDDLHQRKGKVITKAYDLIERKWVNSAPHRGIEWMDHFGCQMEQSALLKACAEVLDGLDYGQYRKFEDIVNRYPDIKYLPNQAKNKLISDLETTLNLSWGRADQQEIFIKKAQV